MELAEFLMKYLVVLGIGVFIGGLWWFGYLGPVRDRGTRVSIRDTEFRVDVASTPATRARGLSGRENLDRGEGMLFTFEGSAVRSFWMKDMLIPIDIIWINEGKVVGFAEDVQPEPGVSWMNLQKYASPEPVDLVLEVQAGTVSRLGILLGDGVVVK